jgi:1,4-dihydroxy-2-naphthoate octaprenyltransferase
MGVLTILRASRAGFLPASILPFMAGALLALKEGYLFPPEKFLVGLAAVISAHLSANLFNDYFDHKSGSDTTEKKSPFFGGALMIQEGALSPAKIFLLGLCFAFLSLVCAVFLAFFYNRISYLVIAGAAGALAYWYTAPPFRFAYRRSGEVVIFLLFGVLLVTGSYFLYSGRFSYSSFLISLPVAFLIVSVIIANEVPDLESDLAAGKRNLVSFVGKERAYLLYLYTTAASYLFILLNVSAGILAPAAALLAILYPAAIPAAMILKRKTSSISQYNISSALAIFLHFSVCAGLIASVIL